MGCEKKSSNFESAKNVRNSNVVEFECELHHSLDIGLVDILNFWWILIMESVLKCSVKLLLLASSSSLSSLYVTVIISSIVKWELITVCCRVSKKLCLRYFFGSSLFSALKPQQREKIHFPYASDADALSKSSNSVANSVNITVHFQPGSSEINIAVMSFTWSLRTYFWE